MTAKKGNARLYAPEVEAELQRLWETQPNSPRMICERVNSIFDTDVQPDRLGWKAKREGWKRWVSPVSSENRFAHEERLQTKSLLRSRRVSPNDNRVALVAPETFRYSGGFRLGGGVP
jgi:hypothetical protein